MAMGADPLQPDPSRGLDEGGDDCLTALRHRLPTADCRGCASEPGTFALVFAKLSPPKPGPEAALPAAGQAHSGVFVASWPLVTRTTCVEAVEWVWLCAMGCVNSCPVFDGAEGGWEDV